MMSRLACIASLLLLAACASAASASLSAPTFATSDELRAEELEFNSRPDLWTPLQEYVATFDPTYTWTYMPENNHNGTDFTAYMINMTSQTWLTSAQVNRPVWTHTMYVFVPTNLNATWQHNALNWLGNHYNDDENPANNLFPMKEANMFIASIACVQLQTIVSVIFQIPNQRLIFADDPTHQSRREDENIAWTWKHFLANPNETEWLLRLPMTKAAVRAMDTVEAFARTLLPTGPINITRWIVSGPSKRGWTSYTVAACNPDRIVGFAPLVLDEANFTAAVIHQYRSYAGWSFALEPYLQCNAVESCGIVQAIGTPNYNAMMDIVAPITYAPLLTMPKLFISASGDEFGMPDDILSYWDELLGEKDFRLMPNIDHSMEGDPLGVLQTLVSWALLVQRETPKPKYEWDVDSSTGEITLQVDPSWAPIDVVLWQANTILGNERRDFRLAVWNETSQAAVFNPVWWTSSTVFVPHQMTYSSLLDVPPTGWIGFFLEINWSSIGGSVFKTSTGVSILPMTYPSEMCTGEECNGPIV